MYISNDFYFNGQKLSDYGFIICDFGDNDGMKNASAGSAIEYNTSKPPRSHEWMDIGGEYSEPLEFEIAICKNPDALDEGEYNNGYLTIAEERKISKWLKQNQGFQEFYFVPTEIGQETIFFFARITGFESVRICSSIVGYKLTITTNAPFGFSEEKVTEIVGSSSTSVQKIIDVDSDERDHIFPKITVFTDTPGDVYIDNVSNESSTYLYNLTTNETVIIDKAHIGIKTNADHNIIANFNKRWLRLSDGSNTIKVNGKCNVTISYREPRKVGS